ncbi:protein containing DUF820 [mine drainage metagenome]|uniref:Protein containing DUF820 n=1 Tax=mine drainage metagenome TaxID=410659 RepID=T1DC75_9ZZZZ
MARIEPKWSYGHLRELPDDGNRYEIGSGELLVTPAPGTRHQAIVGNLFDLLRRAALHGHGKVFVAPVDVVFSPHDVLEPDLVFVSSGNLPIVKEPNIEGAPDLVVEVLSASTRERDLSAKLHIYSRYGVRYYWAVDPKEECVHLYERVNDALVERPALRQGDTLASPLFPDVSGSVVDVFKQ